MMVLPLLLQCEQTTTGSGRIFQACKELTVFYIKTFPIFKKTPSSPTSGLVTIGFNLLNSETIRRGSGYVAPCMKLVHFPHPTKGAHDGDANAVRESELAVGGSGMLKGSLFMAKTFRHHSHPN